MEASALLDNLMDVGLKIDNLWSMYIGVQLAAFWLVMTIPRPLIFIERIVAFGGLAMFNVINGRSLYSSYQLLDVLRIEITETANAQLTKHPLLLNYLLDLDLGDRGFVLFLTHGGALLVVGVIIAFQSAIFRRYMRVSQKHAAKN